MSASIAVPAGQMSAPSDKPAKSRYQMALDSGLRDFTAEGVVEPSVQDSLKGLDRATLRSKDHSKVGAALGTVGKVAAGTAILGGAAVVGAGAAVAGKANKMRDCAVNNVESGLLEALISGMSASPLEERIARSSTGLEDKKSKKKDSGLSL